MCAGKLAFIDALQNVDIQLIPEKKENIYVQRFREILSSNSEWQGTSTIAWSETF